MAGKIQFTLLRVYKKMKFPNSLEIDDLCFIFPCKRYFVKEEQSFLCHIHKDTSSKLAHSMPLSWQVFLQGGAVYCSFQLSRTAQKKLQKLGLSRRFRTQVKKCDYKLAFLDGNLRKKSTKQRMSLQRVKIVFSDSQCLSLQKTEGFNF